LNYNGPKVIVPVSCPGVAPLKSDLEECSWPNAGNTVYPALPALPSHPISRVDGMPGDNVSGAANQQERPLSVQWVVGFVDGEGCFSVPIFRNRSCRLGWQVQPEFAVVQGARSVQVLLGLKHFFGCGSVDVNRRHDNHREDVWRYHVRRLSDLSNRVIPCFEANSLRTAKAGDFAGFATVVRMMERGAHLSEAGLRRIAEIAATMNRRKRSQLVESSEAIRQPSRLDGRDEDMVLAPWRHGGT
jgi:hypothetical protein